MKRTNLPVNDTDVRAKRFRVDEVALSLGEELLGRHFPAEEFVLRDLKLVRDAIQSVHLQKLQLVINGHRTQPQFSPFNSTFIQELINLVVISLINHSFNSDIFLSFMEDQQHT